jgi:peptidoglycan LD-endopeptidase CwlK
MLLTPRDYLRLRGVNPDLVKVVKHAAKIHDGKFFVIQGLRTLAQQREYVRRGASKTMRSRHLTGHAVDLGVMIGRRLTWEAPAYHDLAECMKKAAREVDVVIEWGGDWRSFFDGPHFQLPWRSYPASVNTSEGGKIGPRYRNLTLGSKGPRVVTMQKKLGIKADGDFGPKTLVALKKYQRKQGLKADGIAGPVTLKKLGMK